MENQSKEPCQAPLVTVNQVEQLEVKLKDHDSRIFTSI